MLTYAHVSDYNNEAQENVNTHELIPLSIRYLETPSRIYHSIPEDEGLVAVLQVVLDVTHFMMCCYRVFHCNLGTLFDSVTRVKSLVNFSFFLQ